MFSLCISVFRFVQLTAALKLVPLQPYGRKHLLLKNANARIFSTVSCRQKFLHSKINSTANSIHSLLVDDELESLKKLKT